MNEPNDLPKRLRNEADQFLVSEGHSALLNEAADEIERLRMPSMAEMIALAYKRDPEAMKKADAELLAACDMTETFNKHLRTRNQ